MTPTPEERPSPPDSEHYEDLELWVLDHGLPALPSVLGDDEQVPVASWTGPACGVVLSRYREVEDGESTGVGDVCDDHQAYRRSATGWEAESGAGGSCGTVEDPLRPPPLPARYAAVFVSTWQTGSVAGCVGLVGSAARTIELTDRYGLTRHPVDAPVGLVIVCFDADDDVTVRVLDGRGDVLAHEQETAAERNLPFS